MKKKKAFLEIGKVIATHGLKGYVKVMGWCDDVYVFKSLSFLYFDANGEIKKKIKKVGFYKNSVIILFSDIFDVESALELVNKILYFKRQDIKLKPNHNFIQDLIDVEIYDHLNKDLCYGKIVNVFKTKAHAIYEVVDEQKKEKLIPATENIIVKKDLKNNRIYIKKIEGLF